MSLGGKSVHSPVSVVFLQRALTPLEGVIMGHVAGLGIAMEKAVPSLWLAQGAPPEPCLVYMFSVRAMQSRCHFFK